MLQHSTVHMNRILRLKKYQSEIGLSWIQTYNRRLDIIYLSGICISYMITAENNLHTRLDMQTIM